MILRVALTAEQIEGFNGVLTEGIVDVLVDGKSKSLDEVNGTEVTKIEFELEKQGCLGSLVSHFRQEKGLRVNGSLFFAELMIINSTILNQRGIQCPNV